MSSVWTQFRRLKAQVPGCLLLFRYGDFYEMFGEDAEIAAPILDIALTSREMGRGNRVALAGIPYHALDNYLPKLVGAGQRVAIVEQVGQTEKIGPNSLPVTLDDDQGRPAREEPPDEIEDDEGPTGGRAILERRIARVVTAGTIVSGELSDERSNNYLASAIIEEERGATRIGLAFCDATTGEFLTTELRGQNAARQLISELERLEPRELLVPRPDRRSQPVALPTLPASLASTLRISREDAWRFDRETARESLLRHYEVSSLDGLGFEGMPLALRAAGAIVSYLKETLRSASARLSLPRVYGLSGTMSLDTSTRQNLELFESGRAGDHHGSLLWALDLTKTPMGGRLLRRWVGQPLNVLEPLLLRQMNVRALFSEPVFRAQVFDRLKETGDIERLITRVAQGLASPRDLFALARSLRAVEELRALGGMSRFDNPISRLILRFQPEGEVIDLIERAIAVDPPAAFGEGVIRSGFSPELDELIASTKHAHDWIAALEPTERERTGIRTLKVSFNRVFGYYLEISNANRDLVPESYIRKQTLVGAERYITPELKEYESIVLGAKEKRAELESEVFRRVRTEVASARERVLTTASLIAELDVYASLAEVASRQNYVQPELTDGPELRIIAGRHPMVERSRPESEPMPFVPNDVWLTSAVIISKEHGNPDDDDPLVDQGDRPAQIVLLTGPNMAGKSTYLRQVALIVIMAQIGSFVPARSARIGLVDRVFTRIGARDDLSAGQSTFLVEMIETANLLTQSTPRSLLVLDEVGRGTSTYDGLAIAQAVIEHIHNHPRLQARTLFATHFHELTELERHLPRVQNFQMAVKETDDAGADAEKVAFLHRVDRGGADRSYGIHVARLAGVPRGVTRRAEDILRELEEGKPTRGRNRRRERAADADGGWQLSLFIEPNAIVEELKTLDVLSLSPIEALTRLFELQKKAKEGM